MTMLGPKLHSIRSLSPKLHSIWSLTPQDRELFSQRIGGNNNNHYTSSSSSSSHGSNPSDSEEEGALPSSLLDEDDNEREKPFFGPDNTDPCTIVVGRHNRTLGMTSLKHVQLRFGELRTECNHGYGIVPISNTFTETSAVPGSEEDYYEFNPKDLLRDVRVWTTGKKSARSSNPPTPKTPADPSEPLVLFQIGFPSGRQGVFQGRAQSQCGEQLAELVGEYVVVAQDDGVDIGLLRGMEPLQALVRHIPEVPYMPVLRKAMGNEIERIKTKLADELVALHICRELLQTKAQWETGMVIEACEFQYDRHKLVVYAKMKGWLNFNSFVKALHTLLKTRLGHQPRVFVQRRFAD
ncbi:hypothetical protein BASA81_003812 [Batrachochytrium salamandrivorans]|nr:hypothetical protein BASA81_003812 [Batrachochytrium salamandrivorans]